jgi:hypothetical protein
MIREEPEKQKTRSALFASRLRDCGRGKSLEAAPNKKREGKGKNVPRQFGRSRWRPSTQHGSAKRKPPLREKSLFIPLSHDEIEKHTRAGYLLEASGACT